MRRFLHRRRRYGSHGERKISPWIIIAICAAVALIVTIVIGNLLKLWLDDETYNALTGGNTGSSTGEETAPKDPTPEVRANAFVLGDSTDDLWENPAVSILINTPDGTVCYPSPTASHLGYTQTGSVSIADGFEVLRAAASHISGVFYPHAYALESADLRYAETAREAALLHEFLAAGGNEIVLCGLPWDSETIERSVLLDYLRDLRSMLGQTPIGTAIPLSIANDGNNWRLLSQLAELSDFCLLDLREADSSRAPEEWLSEYNYFRKQYRMRLFLGADQTDLAEAAKEYTNVQFVTAVATPAGNEE